VSFYVCDIQSCFVVRVTDTTYRRLDTNMSCTLHLTPFIISLPLLLICCMNDDGVSIMTFPIDVRHGDVPIVIISILLRLVNVNGALFCNQYVSEANTWTFVWR